MFEKCTLVDVILALLVFCSLDTELERCEKHRSILKRRLAASAVEIERQVIWSSTWVVGQSHLKTSVCLILGRHAICVHSCPASFAHIEKLTSTYLQVYNYWVFCELFYLRPCFRVEIQYFVPTSANLPMKFTWQDCHIVYSK